MMCILRAYDVLRTISYIRLLIVNILKQLEREV